MSDRWYANENGKRIGPLSFEQLKRLARRLRSDDLVWNEGASVWVPVASVPGLRAESKAGSPASEESVSDLTVPVGQEAPYTVAKSQASKPGHPLPYSNAKWGWVGALIAGIVFAAARYAAQQNNARPMQQPVQPPAPQTPQKPTEKPKPVENRPQFDPKKAAWLDKQNQFDVKNQFPPPPLFVQQNKLLPTDITARWILSKDSHELVLVNMGATLRDVSLQITLHEVDGFKFSIPASWETWRMGEERKISVIAHNYPKHEVQGKAVRGSVTVEINLYLNWTWIDGLPSTRK